jgi:hypothetical protein
MLKFTSALLLCGLANGQNFISTSDIAQQLANILSGSEPPPAQQQEQQLVNNNAPLTSRDDVVLTTNAGVDVVFKTIIHPNQVDVAATTTNAAVATEGGTTSVSTESALYVLKYPQQACAWSDYTEGADWVMFSTGEGTNDVLTCAAGCIAADGCTGFEVGSDSGESYNYVAYCSFWLNNACSVPTSSFEGAFSLSTGEYVTVDTYTLTAPIDAFDEYEASGCVWNNDNKGIDWDYTDLETKDAASCAKLCLERDDCTGFEVGDIALDETLLGQGYCALWFNNTCTTDELVSAKRTTSTYLKIYTGTYDCRESFMFYMIIIVTFLGCLGVCCCCRRAMLRRRLQMQMQMRLATAAARRASLGTVATVPVTVEGQSNSSRAIVYAVCVEDQQEEPAKQ